MSVRQRPLDRQEIADAFRGSAGDDFPVILSPERLANLLNLSVKTIYEWIARGRLDGAFRKRGKHILIWRDRAIDILFNGKQWRNSDEH